MSDNKKVKIKFKELQNFCRSARVTKHYHNAFFYCNMISRKTYEDNRCCVENCRIIEKE